MSKLVRLIKRRKDNKRLSDIIGVYQENGDKATATTRNATTAEVLQQLRPEVRRGVDQQSLGAVPAPPHKSKGSPERTIAQRVRVAGQISANRSHPIADRRNSAVPIEVDDRSKDAHLERDYSFASEVVRGMSRAHENDLRSRATRTATRYPAFDIDTDWLAGSPEHGEGGDATSRDLSLFDEDFELVLRHFWKQLDPDKRRKLIQMAAYLVDLDAAGDCR